MIIIRASSVDWWGNSNSPVSVIDGANLAEVGNTDGPVRRLTVMYNGEAYTVIRLPKSIWMELQAELF